LHGDLVGTDYGVVMDVVGVGMYSVYVNRFFCVITLRIRKGMDLMSPLIMCTLEMDYVSLSVVPISGKHNI
jgi:hypothetical protein